MNDWVPTINANIQQFLSGSLNWLQLADALCDAVDQGLNLEDLSMDSRRTKEMIRAYRFLQVQRPEYLKNPEPLIAPDIICYLPHIYKTISKNPIEEKEEEFQKIVDKVLEGKINTVKIRKISREFSGKAPRQRTEQKPNGTQVAADYIPIEKKKGDMTVEALSNAMDVVDQLLDINLEEKSFSDLRPLIGEKCHQLSIRLSCVADEGFLKLWNKRRTGYV